MKEEGRERRFLTTKFIAVMILFSHLKGYNLQLLQ